MVSADLIEDAIKQAAFIKYLERNTAGTRDASNYISELINSVKDAQKKALSERASGSNSPNTIDLYNQAKSVAPGIAGAGFAKAGIFAEYVVKEISGAVHSIMNKSGDLISNLRSIAPNAIDAADTIGEKMADFIISSGPTVIRAMETAGNGMFAFFHEYAPVQLQDAAQEAGVGVAQLVSIVARDMPGALGDLQQIVSAAAPGVLAAAKNGLGVIIENAPGVAGVAMDVAGSAIGAVSNAITSETAVEITTAALSALGTASAAFPFLLPIQIAVMQIGNAIQHATYNREAAEILATRCADCSLMAAEMAPKLQSITQSVDEQERSCKPLVTALNECNEFLLKFTKKGFISVMITWKRDDRSLMNLDKKVTNAIQTLSVRVNGYQIDRQVADSDKLDKVFSLLNGVSAAALSQPAEIDPKILAEVARKAGCTTANEISGELEGLGFKLDQIKDAVEEVMFKIATIDRKLDSLGDQLLRSAESQKQQNEELKNIILKSHAEMRKQEMLTLEAMRSIASGKGEVAKKYSSLQQTRQMARRALEVATSNVELIIIHSHGVGNRSRVLYDGEDGVHGRAGQGFIHGRDGTSGTSYTIDGQDGERAVYLIQEGHVTHCCVVQEKMDKMDTMEKMAQMALTAETRRTSKS